MYLQCLLLSFLLLSLVGPGDATWFEENVYKDSKRVVEEDSRVSTSQERDGLLSVLLSLDQLYGSGGGSVVGERGGRGGGGGSRERVKVSFQPSKRDRDTQEERDRDRVRGSFIYADDDNDDDDVVDEEVTVLKRVLPPLGELCRLMHMKGCAHSRHK